MGLPNRENAYIPLSKLRDYLLSKTHPVGRWKAVFFQSLGFDETNIDMLERGLIAIANSGDVMDVVPSAYGTKYVIDGLLQTPTAGFINVRTVWIIDKDEGRPRFVTAYPL